MAKRGRHQYVRDATDDNAEIVSRSQRKRDSAALQAKGEELALLPEPVTLSDVKEPPEKPPDLIAGVLRRGHKALIAGPSKAAKSFLLIELAIPTP